MKIIGHLCSPVVECLLDMLVRSISVNELQVLLFFKQGVSRISWCDRASDWSLMVYPLSYYSFQPVFHNWCNEGWSVCGMVLIRRKQGNVLFNDTLNTFYLWLYGVGHMVKDHSDSERGDPLPPHGLLFVISSKGSFICTIPQTGYHIPQPLLHQSWSTGWNDGAYKRSHAANPKEQSI